VRRAKEEVRRLERRERVVREGRYEVRMSYGDEGSGEDFAPSIDREGGEV